MGLPPDAGDGELVRAIEDNAAAMLLEMGRLGGGRQRDDPDLAWSIGGSPLDYHNCVVRADLPPAAADEAIARSREEMAAYAVPGSWHIGPSMRPDDIDDRLRAAGFVDDGTEPGMAVDLGALATGRPAPDGLLVERVADEAGLAAWESVLASGFGEGEREARWVASIYRAAGYAAPASPWRHFLARIDGVPVGTATTYLAAGVVGLYFVSTTPAARRRGVGAAVTLAALHDARELGCRVGVLQSSAAGRSVYAGLGFRELCTFQLFTWDPAGR